LVQPVDLAAEVGYRLGNIKGYSKEEAMSRQKITRRDALGIIAKTGVTLGAGTCFFLSLKTSPLEAAPWDSPQEKLAGQKRSLPKKIKSVAEKVVISGSGSTLIVRISGPAGRHCGVAYATADSKQHYKAVPRGRGIIGKDGLCTIQVDVKSLPSQKVYLRVVTGSKSDFTASVKGTKPFEVHISKGIITRFGGATGRALEDATVVASVATAGYQSKKR
jgi:hypothetical protein